MSQLQYPVCLNTSGQRCVVVGGGTIASRKAAELIRCGAEVTIVSPRLAPETERLVERGEVALQRRPFEPRDVEEAFLVIAATNDFDVNRQVSEAAIAARALVNAVDQPSLCQFTVPALLRRGLLTVAVSTGGAGPGLAGQIRDRIAEIIGPEWADVIEGFGGFRRAVLERFEGDAQERRRLLDEAMSMDLLGAVREGGLRGLSERLVGLISKTADGEAER